MDTANSSRAAQGPVRAVIFDLDGVLVDSEPNYLESEQRLLADYGIRFTAQMKRQYIGMGTREMADDVASLFRLPQSVDLLVPRKNAYYLPYPTPSTTPYPPPH